MAIYADFILAINRSSYREYIVKSKFIETDFALRLFSNNRLKSIERFREFHKIEGQERCLDIDQKKKWKDADAIELIKSICHVASCKEVQKLNKEKQSRYFKTLNEKGLSVRQISRLTGIGRWIIQKACQ